MSLDRYQQSLALMKLPPNEILGFPKWLIAYAGDTQVKPRIGPGGEIPVERDLVIGFLRSLRDNQVQAWRRLQATRAIEIYQTSVLRTSVVDFRPIRDKLNEIAGREKRASGGPQYDPDLVAGEGNAGVLDENELEPIRRMRQWSWAGAQILAILADLKASVTDPTFSQAHPLLRQSDRGDRSVRYNENLLRRPLRSAEP